MTVTITPSQLKAWRNGCNLSQAELADAMGLSSRFVVARWESGDALSGPTQARLAAAMASMGGAVPVQAQAGHRQPATSPQLPPAASRWRHPRWLDVTGAPCSDPFAPGHRHKPNTCFWRLDWDDEDGVEHYNLYQAWLDGELLCTAVRMNAETWRVRADFMRTPEVLAVVSQLNVLLTHRQSGAGGQEPLTP